MEPATIDRIQALIDAEAAERFPPGAVPQLALLRHGDHPIIEPGELYLGIFLGSEPAARDAWMDQHFDGLEDFRAQRLPEVKGFIVTADALGSGGVRLIQIRKMEGISLLDPEEDEIARGLTPMMARLGPADLATLDMLVIAGIAASRAEAARWSLARIREHSARPQLGGPGRDPGHPEPRADALDQAGLDQLQHRLDEQVREYLPDGGVQRVVLLQYGDDPQVEPRGLLIQVFVEETVEARSWPAWHREHDARIRELLQGIAENLPGPGYLELFWSGADGHKGQSRHRLGTHSDDAASSERDLTPADLRLGPADLETLDALITAGTAASRAEAVGWVLARIRERPAYPRLSERARELNQLRAHF